MSENKQDFTIYEVYNERIASIPVETYYSWGEAWEACEQHRLTEPRGWRIRYVWGN